jgi:hypothetical protein
MPVSRQPPQLIWMALSAASSRDIERAGLPLVAVQPVRRNCQFVEAPGLPNTMFNGSERSTKGLVVDVGRRMRWRLQARRAGRR